MPGISRTQTSPQSIEPWVDQLRAIAAKNPDKFVQAAIYIITDTAKKELIKYRYGQQLVAKKLSAMERQGYPCRLYILKSRQIGSTTQIAVRNFVKAWSTNNRSLVTIAQLEKRASDILKKLKFAYANLHPSLQLALSHDSKDSLAFADTFSSVSIISAKNIEAVRSLTVQEAHLSEFALYDDAEMALYEVGQVCHYEPGTSIVLETTGKNFGSYAHYFYRRCKAKFESYDAIFLDWQSDPECDIKFKSAKDMDRQVQLAYDFEPRLEELQRLYRLTPGNIVWSYGILKHRLAGSWETFLQDYPLDEEMAWRSKGELFFGSANIAKLLKITGETPYELFTLDRERLETEFKSFDELPHPNQDFDLLDKNAPHIVVWAGPRFGREYIISGDSGLGSVGGDPSSTFVIDQATGEQMAEFHGLVQPHQHANVMMALGYIYNTAMLVPEANSIGTTTLDYILRAYPRVYRWRKLDDIRNRLTNAAGWWTSQTSRRNMLALLARIVEEVAREGTEITSMLRSRGLINEMRSFVENPERGAPEAASGAQDDRIMAAAIAYYVAAQEGKGLKDDILNLLRPASQEEQAVLNLPRLHDNMPVSDIIKLTRQRLRLDEYGDESDEY